MSNPGTLDSLLGEEAASRTTADPVRRPFVSVILPAYNEERRVEENLTTLVRYMESIEAEYQWEMIVVNDGSSDRTGALIEEFAKGRGNIHVVHHKVNFGLGQALRTGFSHCRGDYVVTMDFDLSYSPDHIGRLLKSIRDSGAKVVVASPYMEGGRISHVPWTRLAMSVWANRFLSRVAERRISTLTGMVRAYDGKFLRSLNLKAMAMDINAEVIYKAMLLRATIGEIPGHLDWSLQRAEGARRQSSMRVFRHTLSVLLSGFLFKPFLFFVLPGFALFLFSLYANGWMFVHFVDEYLKLDPHASLAVRASAAVGSAYHLFPHTFIVGLISLMLAIQLMSLGILALQNKKYFEEVFHLGTSVYRAALENRGRENGE